MKQTQKKIRIGIIGTGRIASRFIPEAETIEEVEVTSIFNPRLSSAREFAEKYGIANAVDQLNEFLSEVDAAYIAAPHDTHVSYARQALSAGKHVLCEKPMAFTAKEAKELFHLAAAKKLVLMEALKSAYCPGFRALLDQVKGGAIGKVCDVEACFTKLSPSNVREIWDEQYGGSFPELGTYPLLPIVKLLGTESVDIQFQSICMENGKDGYTKAMIRYPDAIALAKTGLSVKSEGQLLVSGTRGYILAEAPWWLTKKFEVRYEDSARREAYEFPFEGAGLRYEIQAFADQVRAVSSHKDMQREMKVLPEESIWIAGQMEAYLAYTKRNRFQDCKEEKSGEREIGIWAHRGCSMRYPENTLEAFAAAASIKGITGIELDVQLTKDGELAVIHDETVDRTTNGSGAVRDYTLAELKALVIQGNEGRTARIPTLEEVFQLLQPACCDNGLMINIELKNSRIRYEGMEEKLLKLVEQYHLNSNIVYSSFLPESMGFIKHMDPEAKTAILGKDALECLKEMENMQADAIHPWNGGLPLNRADLDWIRKIPVRVWNMEEPFFGQNNPRKETNLRKYAVFGATDIITNVPEDYIKEV